MNSILMFLSSVVGEKKIILYAILFACKELNINMTFPPFRFTLSAKSCYIIYHYEKNMFF